MTRDEVVVAIGEERKRQDQIWGTLKECPHGVASWLTFMRVYLNQAEILATKSSDNQVPLQDIIKLIALGFACLEQHGKGEE